MMVVAAPAAEAAIGCPEVTLKLVPCLDYVKTGATAVPPGCCSGVSSLLSMANTTADRQNACNCLKSLAASLSSNAINKAAGIPGKCGVSVPFKISLSTD
ncbi:unnamed protein product [Thlaspi arvense]|uniref:Non-specific lipid-transfer protein n=1 Tax=Thlaspi arvense TaxID=13288 RepID=A0AAU9S3U8_THLAR|nr:unnamed protein product [Thlaspi arvense]